MGQGFVSFRFGSMQQRGLEWGEATSATDLFFKECKKEVKSLCSSCPGEATHHSG